MGRGHALLLLRLRPERRPPPAARRRRGHVMTLVVGITPDGHRGAAAPRGMLARSGGDLHAALLGRAAVVAAGLAKVDAEYRAYLENTATEVLERARTRLPDDVRAESVVQHARSAAAGLVELAEQHEDAALVGWLLGRRRVRPRVAGQRRFGTSAAQLAGAGRAGAARLSLQARPTRDARDRRVRRPGGPDDLVVAAAGLAARVGASLRIASFAVRSRPPYTSGVGSGPEAALIPSPSGARRSRRPGARRSNEVPRSAGGPVRARRGGRLRRGLG